MNVVFQIRHAIFVIGGKFENSVDDLHAGWVLDEAKIRVLGPPPVGRIRVGVDEKVGPTRISRRPRHGAPRHDGTVTPAVLVPFGAIVFNGSGPRRARPPDAVGGDDALVGHDSLEDAWFFGPIKVAMHAPLAISSVALDQFVNVVHGSLGKIGAESDLDVAVFGNQDQKLWFAL